MLEELDSNASFESVQKGGLIIVDAYGVVRHFDSTAERILGQCPADLEPSEWAKHYGLYLPDTTTIVPTGATPLERALRGEASEEMEIFISSSRRPKSVWCAMTGFPLPHELGGGAMLVLRDITERRLATESLRMSADRLKAIVENAVDAIITIDLRGMIQTFNHAAEMMFGYSEAEVKGNNIRMLMPSPYRNEHDGYIRHYRETREARIIGIGREVHAQRKDGTTFPIHLSVSETPRLGIFTGIIRDMSRERTLQQEIVSIVMHEQERIGEDLHDGLGQELTGLALQVEGLARRLDVPNAAEALEAAGYEDLRDRAHRASEAIATVRNHLRRVVKGLVPLAVASGGLPEALEKLVETSNQSGSVSCTASIDKTVLVDDAEVAGHIYRIAQEAVNNTLKHSQASKASICLAHLDGSIVLEIADNGIGIEAEHLKENDAGGRDGMGLRIMRHRARLAGAALTINRNDEGGTTVRCILQTGS